MTICQGRSPAIERIAI